jgi:hypothetical protein
VSSFDSLPTEIDRHVDKSCLYDCINDISQDATDIKEALPEIERTNDEKGTSKNPDILSKVRVEANKFSKMCVECFIKVKGSGVVKAQFERYINSIQAKMDLINSYNQTVLKMAQLEFDMA